MRLDSARGIALSDSTSQWRLVRDGRGLPADSRRSRGIFARRKGGWQGRDGRSPPREAAVPSGGRQPGRRAGIWDPRPESRTETQNCPANPASLPGAIPHPGRDATDRNGIAESVGHWSFRLHNKAKHCTGTGKEWLFSLRRRVRCLRAADRLFFREFRKFSAVFGVSERAECSAASGRCPFRMRRAVFFR